MLNPQQRIDLAAKFIDQVRSDPKWFATDVLNHRVLKGEKTLKEDPGASWELDIFQGDLLEAVADVWRKAGIVKAPTRINHEGKNQITVRSGHGPGKTHTAALIAHLMLTAFRCRIVCTAPKLAQLRTRLWAAIRKIDARAEPWYRTTHVIHDTAVYVMKPDGNGRMVEDRDWCILAETASHPENLAGHHEMFQLVIVEEGTGVPESLFPVIFGALSTGVIQILLMISNPTKNTGTFALSHLRAAEAKNWFRYHINLKNARRINRDWVHKMETKYGKDSPIVKIRVHGEFADASARQLIANAWMMDALDREVRGSDGSVGRMRLSIDVSDGGEDETVIGAQLIYDSRSTLIKVRRFSFSAIDAIGRAADAAEQMFAAIGADKKRDDIVVDSLGVGSGVRDMLIRKGYRVVEYIGGSSSDQPDRWRNRRVQSYLCLRDRMRDGLMDIADDCFDSIEDTDEWLAQMASVELSDLVSGERVEDLITKTTMKDRGLPSPDMADMTAMLFCTVSPVIPLPDGMTYSQAFEVVPGNDYSDFNIGGLS